jgi:hypothetical protein
MNGGGIGVTVLKCKICGGDLKVQAGAAVGTCLSCGSTVTLPPLDDDKRSNLYNRANRFRRAYEYDKAALLYENILAGDASDAEAYWSLVLCRFGVEYVEDPQNRKMVPTCNRAQDTSIYADEDYRQALAIAQGEARFLYEEEARKIDDIQRGILAISRQETTLFDVFICYKETDDRGRRTKDSVLAQDIYDELTSGGYRVFFSRVTLEDKLGTAYEPYIFAALNSAAVMLAVGTSPEHLDAVWVKNEWNRYLALIKAGARKTLIPVYRDIAPSGLPDALRQLQGLDMGQVGSMRDLLRNIRKIVVPAGSRPAIEEWSAGELRLNENGREVLGFAGEPSNTLVIPDGVTSVAAGAFAGCAPLETAIFPEGMTAIAAGAFSGCSRLKALGLPADLATIEDGAFANCAALDALLLDENVQTVGAGAFAGCTALADISFSYKGLKNIGSRAFAGCSPQTLDLPRSLETIGEEAFAGCEFLEEISLPVSLRFVGKDAFAGCSALKRVILVKGGDRGDKIPPFSDWGGGGFSAARPEIVIDDGVEIGENSFAGCDYLVSLTIPRMRNIGKGAFTGCAALRNVKIDDGVQSIGESAFAGCAALRGVALPDRLKFIGKNAFAGCPLVRRLTFPVCLEKVEEGAFSGCAGIEKITVKTARQLNYAAMGLNDEKLNLAVSVENHFGDKAFAGFTGMRSVTLSKKISRISAGAFQNCTGLTKLKLPGKLESVGASAFAGCTGLSGELAFPPSINDIGKSAFAGCAALESVTIPPFYHCAIGKNAFAGCTGLRRVDFDRASGVDVGEGAFAGCASLRELRVPSAADIKRRAFADCGCLERVDITGEHTFLGERAFAGCGCLTEVTFTSCGEFYEQFDFSDVFAGAPYIAQALSGVCPKCGVRLRRGKKCETCGAAAPPRRQTDKTRLKILRVGLAGAALIIYALALPFSLWLQGLPALLLLLAGAALFVGRIAVFLASLWRDS